MVKWSEYNKSHDRFNMYESDSCFYDSPKGYQELMYVVDGKAMDRMRSISYLYEKYGWNHGKASDYLHSVWLNCDKEGKIEDRTR